MLPLPNRKRELAEAVWRIAATHGLESVTMREVAAEAHVSLRVVQYNFPGKHDLLVYALRELHRDNETRSRQRGEQLPDPTDMRAVLALVLNEFLPLDAHRRMSLTVYAAYFARSLTDPEIRTVFLGDDKSLENLVAMLIGKLNPAVDAEREADLLVSGITGLGLDILHRRRTVAEVQSTVDYHLDRLSGITRR
ncbi:TetR/AcrR family transcriptional regulator [Pseudonocardiaceae bacterium YIM PH 21723]|nr:TetR/AcrR family transcriptional regulator [Pseudonocardiaceae bacterium YIM PH 21723]